MTAREHTIRHLAAYVRAAADVLALRDWTVDVKDEPCDSDRLADVHVVPYQHLATMRFSADVRDRPLDEIPRTVAHELLHCHGAPADDFIRDDLEAVLGKPTHYVAYQAYLGHVERAVDALARVVTPLLPPFAWPDGKPAARRRATPQAPAGRATDPPA